MDLFLPSLKTDDLVLDKAFRIALADFTGNIMPFKGGLLRHSVPCIMAGLDYDTPWTRDAAINVWNGAALLSPKTAKNTLLSVIIKDKSNVIRIGGQYWDAIIWVTGAWNYYLMTGDVEFLKSAFEISRNSLEYFEKTERDEKTGLFRGPACYGDGVSAYPDVYAKTKNHSSGIEDWVDANQKLKAQKGIGIPIMALSTNALYANAYAIMMQMEKRLGWEHGGGWRKKSEALKKAVNKNFWLEKQGTYRYLADKLGCCDNQEGLGHSFVILFEIADQKQRESVFKKQHITESGIPCVWPAFERYRKNPDHYGRHSGTVWPHGQGFWADACARYGKTELFSKELFTLANHAVRDVQFTEIYHPDTGEIYGGIQEDGAFSPSVKSGRKESHGYEKSVIREWDSCRRQTWSATAFIRMVFNGLFGLRFHPEGISFNPVLPKSLEEVSLLNLQYRNAVLDIFVSGRGAKVKSIKIDGKKKTGIALPAASTGRHKVEIFL